MKPFYFRLVTLALVSLFSISQMRAEDPYQVEWISQLGSSDSNSVSLDNSGNVFIAGEQDDFVSKFSNSGNLLWTKQLGVFKSDSSQSITTDDLGNIFVTGYTGDLYNNADAFLSKYDNSGNLLWSEQIGTDKNDRSYSVTADGIGNAYITGTTSGNLGGNHAGSHDIFLSKYDSSGNLLWIEQFGSNAADSIKSIAVDESGNTYIAGYAGGDLVGNSETISGTFLSKFDSSGIQLWTSQIGNYDAYAYSMAVDKLGNAYFSGNISGYLEGTSIYYADAFLSKIDNSGDLIWTSKIMTDERDVSQSVYAVRVFDLVYSVAVDRSGNPYITGTTEGDLDRRISSAGHTDIFLSKYDSSGNQLWIEEIGTGYFEKSLSVAIEDTGNAYITGFTGGDLWSSYYEGIERGTFSGGAFLVKFSPLPEPSSAILILLAGSSLFTRRSKR